MLADDLERVEGERDEARAEVERLREADRLHLVDMANAEAEKNDLRHVAEVALKGHRRVVRMDKQPHRTETDVTYPLECGACTDVPWPCEAIREAKAVGMEVSDGA